MPLLSGYITGPQCGTRGARNAMRATLVAYLPQQFGRRLAVQRARGYQFAAVEILLMVPFPRVVPVATSSALGSQR